jgi:hypothetical protein
MSTQLKVCFNGCSFTLGEGFPKELKHKYIYDQLLSNTCKFDSTNIAVSGSSNYTIFMRTAEAIQSKKYNMIFTQWSALNRIWLSPGPETYFFINDQKYPDFTYRDIYLSPKEKTQLTDTLLMLNHDYQNIFELIDYCGILNQLAKVNSVKLFFINGLVPWTVDLTRSLNSKDLSSSLSDYTKDMLAFNTRSDDEIILYFSKLQDKFKELDQTNWINLFQSFMNNMVDVGPEGHHPGIISHQWMNNQIYNFLTTNKIL